MKLELFRQSGTPINTEAQELFYKDWQIFFDKASDRAGLDMLKKQRFLAFGERQLLKKHNAKVEIEIPKTAKAWTKLIEQYGDTPVMIARTQDGKRLVLLIMDNLQQ